MSQPYRLPQVEEQTVLDELEIRLVSPEDYPRFQSLLRRHHYLQGIKPVGERLYYVAWWRGHWLALLVFCAAARHLRHRDQWIGWPEAQRRQRLGLVTNNARFLILPPWHFPNLATRVMGLTLTRLPQDWQVRYGHPVWLAESFVDTQLFRGTAYKASGWRELGPTQGYGRCQQDYYVKHGRPKALWVKELKPNARRSLWAEHLPLPSPEQGDVRPGVARSRSVARGGGPAGLADAGARPSAPGRLAGRRWQGLAPRPRRPNRHANAPRQPVLPRQSTGRAQVQRNPRRAAVIGAGRRDGLPDRA